MLDEVLVVIGLLLAVEGALYALFPAAMQRMMTFALAQPPNQLRSAGLLCATIGLGIVWLLRR
jgi:uncharacterized protein YjeT (DUF2065 family)